MRSLLRFNLEVSIFDPRCREWRKRFELMANEVKVVIESYALDPIKMSEALRPPRIRSVPVVGAILAIVASTTAIARPEASCDAPEPMKKLESKGAVFELLGQNREPIPYREEVTEILSSWFGRRPEADGRKKLDDARMAAAREVVTQCALAGQPGAILLEGAMLGAPGSDQASLKRARERFELAASKGVSIALLGIAMADYRLGDAVHAKQALDRLRELNEEFSTEQIGHMLRSGNVLPKSALDAVPWLVQAATEDNSAEAQHALYIMYSTGEGVARSDSEAQRWLAMLNANPEGNRDWDAEEKIMKDLKRGD